MASAFVRTRNGAFRWSACFLLSLSPTLLVSHSAFGQGTKADYERAIGLAERFSALVHDVPSPPEWVDGGPRFWYRCERATGREFVLVDPDKAEKKPAFDHAKLAAALAKAAGEKVESDALPFTRVRLDGGKVRFRAFDKPWVFDPKTGMLAADANPAADKPRLPRHPDARAGQFDPQAVSPDGKWEASADGFNITLRNRDTNESVSLTTDGTERDQYLGEFYWSPDSVKLVVIREEAGDKTKVTVVESSPPEQGPPRPVTYDLPRPGDKLPRRRPCLFDVGEMTPIAVPGDLFPEVYELHHVRWSRDSRRFTFLYNQRGHQLLRLVAVDGETGKARTVVEESSKTFIDYAYKVYLRHFDATGELLWMSERDGWNHLYLLDAETGAVRKRVTKGDWLVRRVDRVVWFWAHGICPGQDPYHLHYCRVNLDGTGLVVLTQGDGTHEVWVSPDRKFFVDSFSRVDLPPVAELRRMSDGKRVLALETADVSELKKAGWQPPERFVAKDRDGKNDIYGVIFRPSNFDPKKKYPVVEEIYAGPTEYHVPKKFSAVHDPIQPIVELGFVGVMIDGMGTNWRHKAFLDVCSKNLADGGLPDRVAWLKAAGKKHPEFDMSRVGIYGGSAGGRNAFRALTHHNDMYKVAVADSGNHDDRYYHAWYAELYMGWPVGPHYAEQSNVTSAHMLKGKLLLIAGELDRTVDPAITMRVVNALVKADKDFELLIVPGGGHCPADSPAAGRRRMDFLVRNLMGVEPRAK
jgi:dipeptidyl-peptidase 4